MNSYGFKIRQTRRGTVSEWGVSGCPSVEQARQEAVSFALRGGWKAPRRWQFWRRRDLALLASVKAAA